MPEQMTVPITEEYHQYAPSAGCVQTPPSWAPTSSQISVVLLRYAAAKSRGHCASVALVHDGWLFAISNHCLVGGSACTVYKDPLRPSQTKTDFGEVIRTLLSEGTQVQ